jgi:glucuronide carrier protein
VGVYYARDVLGNADLYIAMTVVQTIDMVAAVAIMPPLTETLGKKRTYLKPLYSPRSPASESPSCRDRHPSSRSRSGGSPWDRARRLYTLIFALQADTVDYGDWKTGVRTEGGSYSVLSLMRRAGQRRFGGGNLHNRPRRLRLGRE